MQANSPSPFTIRPFEGEADLPRISAMLDGVEAHIGLGVNRTPDELRPFFTAPHLDPAQDIRLWERDGELCAYSLLETEGRDPSGRLVAVLRFQSLPSVWRQDIDARILAWGEERIRALAGGGAARLQVGVREEFRQRIFTLKWAGYAPIRYFYQLTRSLAEPLPPVNLPLGYALRPAVFEQDAAAWVDLFNDTFVDHFDHHDLTVEAYLHERRTAPDYQPDHDLIALAPDDRFVGFCWSRFVPGQTDGEGRPWALLHQIGTRRGHRQHGLGRALLIAGMRNLQDDGIEVVRLYVDAENPTGATRLYDSVGYSKSFTFVFYAKDLPGKEG